MLTILIVLRFLEGAEGMCSLPRALGGEVSKALATSTTPTAGALAVTSRPKTAETGAEEEPDAWSLYIFKNRFLVLLSIYQGVHFLYLFVCSLYIVNEKKSVIKYTMGCNFYIYLLVNY